MTDTCNQDFMKCAIRRVIKQAAWISLILITVATLLFIGKNSIDSIKWLSATNPTVFTACIYFVFASFIVILWIIANRIYCEHIYIRRKQRLEELIGQSTGWLKSLQTLQKKLDEALESIEDRISRGDDILYPYSHRLYTSEAASLQFKIKSIRNKEKELAKLQVWDQKTHGTDKKETSD